LRIAFLVVLSYFPVLNCLLDYHYDLAKVEDLVLVIAFSAQNVET
jgi:hypothetical protein